MIQNIYLNGLISGTATRRSAAMCHQKPCAVAHGYNRINAMRFSFRTVPCAVTHGYKCVNATRFSTFQRLQIASIIPTL
jgi:hypothetical protein